MFESVPSLFSPVQFCLNSSNRYMLGFHVSVEPFDAEFASPAALLEPAERAVAGSRYGIVETYAPCLEFFLTSSVRGSDRSCICRRLDHILWSSPLQGHHLRYRTGQRRQPARRSLRSCKWQHREHRPGRPARGRSLDHSSDFLRILGAPLWIRRPSMNSRAV